MFNKCRIHAYTISNRGRKELAVIDRSAEIWTTDSGIFLWRLSPQAFKKVMWGIPKQDIPAEFVITGIDFYYSIMIEAYRRIQNPVSENDPQRFVRYQLDIDKFKVGAD
jgi:hypothetical protein